MKFGNPEFFYLFILIPLLVVFYIYRYSKRKEFMRRFGHYPLIMELSSEVNTFMYHTKAVLVFVAVSLIILTLSAPRWGAKEVELKREGVDLIFAIDASRSMLAEDIKPGRLRAATYEISSFIDELKGDRVGIVIFAASSYLACPLTTDYNAFNIFLDVIDPSIMSIQGTRIGDAIRTASEAFVREEKKHKALILITDGEDHESSPVKAAQAAADEAIRIYTIGIGGTQGQPIPLYDNDGNVKGYMKDKNGKPVISRLNEGHLKRIAEVSGGKYFRSMDGSLHLDKIYSDIRDMEKKELRSELSKRFKERYRIFAALALTILLLEMLLSVKIRIKRDWTKDVA